MDHSHIPDEPARINSSERTTDLRATDQGRDALAGTPARLLLQLQRSAGNRAVRQLISGAPRVQRQDEEGTPELVAQLDKELEQVDADAMQNDDLYLRAYANRAALLLRFRSHPAFETQLQLDDFIGQAHQLATTEIDTLNALGTGADLALATTPKGFPLTWSGRVHAALSLGIDPATVLAESTARHSALAAEANALPPRLVDKGLPVALAEAGALREFRLAVKHVQLPAGNAVGDFARSTVRLAQFRFFAAFAVAWEGLVNELSSSVADGTYIPKYFDYQDFVENRQQILRALPERARERAAMSEEDLQSLQQEAVGLGDAALAAGTFGALAGLLSIFAGWDAGADLFLDALHTTDGLVGGSGDGEKISMALRWMWDAGFLGAAGGESFQALLASAPDILKSLAVIVVLQMIPFVDVAVDVYLMFQLGVDVLSQLTELGLALSEVMAARTVIDMERAAARLARVLVAGGLQILIALVTMGVAFGVSALRARAAKIRAAEPALSEAEAMKRAMREAPAAERAPLEATRGLSTWERGLSSDTKPILDVPGVRQRLAGLSDATRRILTLCASPCLPPANQLLAADLARLDGIIQRLGVAGDHPGLREYFYQRRSDLVPAIEALDNGVPPGGSLQDFLNRAIVSGAKLPPGVTVAVNADGRWVYTRAPGGRPAAVLEYDMRSYREHGRDYGTGSFFQSHHGIQGNWALVTKVPGYVYEDARAILLRDGRAGSPHRIVTDLQRGRKADLPTSNYARERELMRKDLEAAGVPERFVAESERVNDEYFGRLYRDSGLTAEQLVKWFGSWVP